LPARAGGAHEPFFDIFFAQKNKAQEIAPLGLFVDRKLCFLRNFTLSERWRPARPSGRR
jgi:hypothetical protein